MDELRIIVVDDSVVLLKKDCIDSLSDQDSILPLLCFSISLFIYFKKSLNFRQVVLTLTHEFFALLSINSHHNSLFELLLNGYSELFSSQFDDGLNKVDHDVALF
jgi:hypothetical protein